MFTARCYNHGMDLERIRSQVVQECGLQPDRPVLTGVSGGPDSLCLADVLDSLGYKLAIAHFNHQLRPQAGEEAHLVEEFARRRGIPFVLGSEKVGEFAETHKLSLEEAARICRYQFLFSQAEAVGAQAVAVGHNADDQVETVLMHLLRGSGLAGLRGMPFCSLATEWSSTIPLVRPLLGIWREEILDYCKLRQLQPVTDLSNQDTTFYRNRLRHELVPYLARYNPQVKSRIWKMANVLGEDYQVLEGQMQTAWADCFSSSGEGYVSLDAHRLVLQPLGLQRALFRRAIRILRPEAKDIEFDVIEKAVAFSQHPSHSGRADLFQRIEIDLHGDYITLSNAGAYATNPDWLQLRSVEGATLERQGDIKLENDWRLSCTLIQNDRTIPETELRDPRQGWLDADAVQFPLLVRTRRPGDRFQPLGMTGHSVKLSDFWINAGVERQARDRWPLVCAGDEIVWIPGFRPAQKCRITTATRQIVHLKIFQER
ncbi:MAG TPA: tRNA lysidine(34) synthetase TilS [Longilinea sp.]|nr:tRNA lysidine(34) synthetase TilS [Longilinea sp.]